MVLKFRTVTFGLFLCAFLTFLAITSFGVYYATVGILKDETRAELQLVESMLTHELDLYLQLAGSELAHLAEGEDTRQVLLTGKIESLNTNLFEASESSFHQHYHFLLLVPLKGDECMLLKSRFQLLGNNHCEEIYSNYQAVSHNGWSAFRNGSEVLLAKSYLVTDSEQQVTGRLIGGVKLSGNRLLLSQLMSRAEGLLDGIRLLFNDRLVSELLMSPSKEAGNPWVAENEIQSYHFSVDYLSPELSIDLLAADDSLASLKSELARLLILGAVAGSLLAGLPAVLLSFTLERQLQAMLSYVRGLVGRTSHLDWQKSSIREFNTLSSEINAIVQELFYQRQALDQANYKLEKLVGEKRILLHKLISNQEKERNYLAQELHDELGQILTAVKVQVALSENHPSMRPDLLEHCATIKHLVGQMYDTVYERILVLRPIELENMGLSQSIRQIPALKSLRQAGIKVVLHIDDQVILSEGVDIHLYRIVQEALTNVLKHAKASEVTVTLRQTQRQIRLQIADNGRGMENTTAGSGYGLLGIKERCEYIGAHLNMYSEKGMVIEVLLPYELSTTLPVPFVGQNPMLDP